VAKIELIPKHGEKLTAQFNPTDIELGKKVPWQAKKHVHGNIPDLEYTEAAAESLVFELMFDGYAEGKDVYVESVSKLLNMMKPTDATGAPPKIEVVWGGFPRFKGVIESVTVKYIMFFANGSPARATARVTMTQADTVRSGIKSSVAGDSGALSARGDRADKVGEVAGMSTREARDEYANEQGEIEPGTPIARANG